MGLGDYYQLAKAKLRTRKIQSRHTHALSSKIGNAGSVGADSYNKNFRTLKGFVKKHDIDGAKNYIIKQKHKAQTSDGYMMK